MGSPREIWESLDDDERHAFHRVAVTEQFHAERMAARGSALYRWAMNCSDTPAKRSALDSIARRGLALFDGGARYTDAGRAVADYVAGQAGKAAP